MIKKLRHYAFRLTENLKSQGLRGTAVKISRTLRRKEKENNPAELKDSIPTVYRQLLSTTGLSAGESYESPRDIDLRSFDLPVRTIAFYLPQFHPIPENDAWWGKGFTEWRNVTKAIPNFVGHYQPHLPDELGYYDLRVPEVMKQQIELARKFGISAFCFYYYWFDGKRLLEKPLDMLLADPSMEMPFCLCWANENWTRRWDGQDKEILIGQSHTVEADFAFIADAERYLRDPRYLRVDGKPVVLIYRSKLLTDPKTTTRQWREFCVEKGIGDLYLLAVETAGHVKNSDSGFDGIVEFPPHGIPPMRSIIEEISITNPDFSGMVFDYNEIADHMLSKPGNGTKLFRTAFPSWDNTARMQTNPLIFHNSKPKYFGSWVDKLLADTLSRHQGEERLLFVNAWNEWAEGAHLEPDRRFGYGYLNALSQSLAGALPLGQLANKIIVPGKVVTDGKRSHDTVVVIHAYYPEVLEKVLEKARILKDTADIFVTVPMGFKGKVETIRSVFPDANIFQFENRGRDIAPYLQLLPLINALGYKYLLKLHTKKTVHRADGDNWRDEALEELLGSEEQIDKIRGILDEGIAGLVGPKGQLVSTEQFMGGNTALVDEIVEKASLETKGKHFNFIAGSMYWANPASLALLESLKLDSEDFPSETGQIDGTLAHAIERVTGLFASSRGYKLIETGSFAEQVNREFKFAKAADGVEGHSIEVSTDDLLKSRFAALRIVANNEVSIRLHEFFANVASEPLSGPDMLSLGSPENVPAVTSSQGRVFHFVESTNGDAFVAQLTSNNYSIHYPPKGLEQAISDIRDMFNIGTAVLHGCGDKPGFQDSNFSEKFGWPNVDIRSAPDYVNSFPKISIIMLTFNNLILNERCLESILQNADYPNFELIVVDNASQDGTPEYLLAQAKRDDRIKVILNQENKGFAGGNNQGAAASTGDYLVFLNNDTIVTRGWLHGLLRALKREESAGMVGPVTNAIGNEAKVNTTYTRISEINQFAAIRAMEHRGKAFQIANLALYCAMIRKDLFDQLGGLDEGYAVGMFEDDDLAMKLKAQGYKLYCAEDVFIHHYHQASFRILSSDENQRIFHQNRERFEKKWNVRWVPHRHRE